MRLANDMASPGNFSLANFYDDDSGMMAGLPLDSFRVRWVRLQKSIKIGVRSTEYRTVSDHMLTWIFSNDGHQTGNFHNDFQLSKVVGKDFPNFSFWN